MSENFNHQIIETLVPIFSKGILVIIVIAIFQVLFLKYLKKKKSNTKDSKYIQELKSTINKLTNENKKLKAKK